MKKTIAFIILSLALFNKGLAHEPGKPTETINRSLAVTVTGITGTSCPGSCDGSGTVNFSGAGTAPYTIQWVGTTTVTYTAVPSSPYTCTGLCAGNYIVRVYNSSSTLIGTISNILINQPAPIALLIDSTMSATCFGGDGAAYVSVLGGTAPYMLQWNDPFNQTGTAIDSLAAGTYTCSITDANNCPATDLVVIGDAAPLSVSITGTSPTCYYGNNGSASVTAGNGTAPYSYLWNDPAAQTGAIANNLVAGTYICAVTDANGCSNSDTVDIIQPAQITLTTQVTNPSACNVCDGQVTIVPSGGSGPYVYTVPNINPNYQVSPVFTGLCPNLSYTVTATDNNGCVGTSVHVFSAGTFNVTPDSCGTGVGTAEVIMNSASGPVSYYWFDINQTTQQVTNLVAGTYLVTFNDSICTFTRNVIIPNVGGPLVTYDATPSGCMPNGTLTLYASGGTGPYMYSVDGSPFSSSSVFSNLNGGSHDVVCKDATGCMGIKEAIIPQYFMNVYGVPVPSACGNNNGSVTLYVTGGTPGYSFSWSNGSTNSTITNLSPGTYSCTIIDAGGCMEFVNYTIDDSPSTLVYGSYGNYDCGNNELQVYVANGTGPYTYSWAPGGQTTPSISDQNVGTYTCTVTDANGCTGQSEHVILNQSNTTVNGNVYADLNGNCTRDPGENCLPYMMIQQPNNSWYAVTQNGSYQMTVPNQAGNFTVQASAAYNYPGQNIQFNCSPNTVILNGNCDSISNTDIAYTPVAGSDLRVTQYCGIARPGFQRQYNIYYVNQGANTVNSSVVTFTLDPLLTFVGSNPAATSVNGNTITWNVGNLTHAQSGHIYIVANVPGIANGGAIGTILHDSVSIAPVAGDNTPADNHYACSGEISGSYDPNMKEVYAANMNSNGAIDTTVTDLYYTVHFQNTGTDTAFTINVTDTISALLNLGSIEIMASSHPYNASIQPGRVLQMKFDNILLVDSNANEALSHGYFQYRIRTNHGLTEGQEIRNTAHIYFDFNPAIITNTVVTPIELNVVGIKDIDTKLNAVVYPNPANSGSFKIRLNDASYKELRFSLFNVSGAKVLDKQLANQPMHEISTAGLTSGIYFYQLINAEGKKMSGKIVIGN